MPAISAEKAGKDFMNTGRFKSGSSHKVIALTLLLFTASCSSDPVDDPIPYQPFPTIVLNINLPEYVTLKNTGGYKTIDGGVRGIIVYRQSATRYLSFERNCSYRPNEACATVEVHASGLYMHDPCCGSMFDFNGNPTGGPAWRPLRRYQTSFNGNEIFITDGIED